MVVQMFGDHPNGPRTYSVTTEAELPASGLRPSDRAYTEDTTKWWKPSSATAWVEDNSFGGSGEANTGSNVGASGVGVFDAKVGVDLQFRKLDPLSTKISAVLNGQKIDLDVPDASTTQKGAVELATDGEAVAGVAVQGNDGRMSNARTPTAHGASAHSGAVLPGGVNESYGAAYLDVAQIAAPANPAAGTRRVFVDSADGKLKIRTSGGSNVSLEEQGGGGSPPTGTGFRHVTGGVEDAAAKLVDTADVNDGQITYAKIQDVSATDKVLGRAAVGAGDVEEIVCTAAGRALIDDADAAAQRTTLGLGALATKATVGTADIDNDAVTYAKLQNVSATSRALGRKTAGAGDAEELTLSELLDFIGSAAQGDVLYRGASTWAKLAAGSAGQFLQTQGAAANPLWATVSSSGASLTRINGSSGAAGADLTWQKLSANSADVTTTTLSASVMSTTGLAVGTYKFRYTILYQTAATSTGIAFGVNFTGTATVNVIWYQVTTGTTASTGVGDNTGPTSTQQLVEGKAHNALNQRIGNASLGVGAANSSIIAVIEGILVVTGTGDLELMIASEVAGSAVRIMANSVLELNKIG